MTEVAEETERLLAGSLSPSRAADFKTCPLLYRFRSIDKLPQRPTPDKARGTLVHAVLDRLFDLPAAERTLRAGAAALVEPEWATAGRGRAGRGRAVRRAGGLAEWLDSARRMVAGYFALEDPSRLEPAAREQLVEAVLDLGDAAPLACAATSTGSTSRPTGEVRVVDYKTGAIPREAYEAKALFQLKFYALVLWRTRGTVPHQLKLMYLADRDTLTYRPDAAELERFERTLVAVWRAIERAVTTARLPGQPQPALRLVRLPGAVPVRTAAPCRPTPRPVEPPPEDPSSSDRPACRRTGGEAASTDRWRRMSNRGAMCRPPPSVAS